MPREKLERRPDPQEITLHKHYTLTSTGLEVRGKPTWEEHEDVGRFIESAVHRSKWWWADWMAYGESRADFQAKLSQAAGGMGVSHKTAENVRAIGRSVPKSRRRDSVDFALHGEVAGLKADQQVFWLAKAETEGWTQRELRVNIRASERVKVLDGQAVLKGMYRVIYADPPWLYSDSAPPPLAGSLGKAERHYPGMTIEELCQLPVPAHALEDSVLFCWVTAPMLYENPGPREVIEAWGFTPKTGVVWDKVLGNYGHYVHVRHEHLIIATRGSCLPDAPVPSPDSILTVRRSNVHSQKPLEARKIIEQLYTRGPYLELFGRERVDNWDVFGNDARLWAQEAATA